ncbi:unnamed protein product, partial [marine sediment metagenome]
SNGISSLNLLAIVKQNRTLAHSHDTPSSVRLLDYIDTGTLSQF